MISVAIVAILLAAPYTAYNTFGALHRERAYRDALHTARRQLAWAHSVPVDDLPPMTVTVPRDGRIELKHRYIDSVRLFHADGSSAGQPLAVDAEHGVVSVPRGLAGRSLVVDYVFKLPVLAEAHYVKDRSVQPEHPMAAGDATLHVLQGDTEQRFAARLPGPMPLNSVGHVVLMDYYAADQSNTLRVVQLGDDLRPLVPAVQAGRHPRLVLIEEADPEPRMRLRLSEVRMP